MGVVRLRGLTVPGHTFPMSKPGSSGSSFPPQNADRFQHAQRHPARPNLRCTRVLRRYRDVALRREVVNFVRLHLLDDPHRLPESVHVPIVENEIGLLTCGSGKDDLLRWY